MTLYKYLFVGLTSSSDLQPHLIGEERESQQALQHHLSREQSPLFCQGLFISRYCWLAGIHHSKMWEEDFIVELELPVSMCKSLGQGEAAKRRHWLPWVLVAMCTVATSFAKIFTHECAGESTHNASLMLPNYNFHLLWQRCSCGHLNIPWFTFQGMLPSS